MPDQADKAQNLAIARLRRRLRGSAQGQTPARMPQDGPGSHLDVDSSIDSSPQDAPTLPSGHPTPKAPEPIKSTLKGISHQDGRKDDQHMESRQPLSKREQLEQAFREMKAVRARKNSTKTKPLKGKLAWKVIHFWNDQTNLQTHKLNSPLSKTIKQSLELIEQALNGKLNVENSLCVQNRKYNYRNFTVAITRMNEVASDPSFGNSANAWASKCSLRNFLRNANPVEVKKNDEGFALRNLSPFIFFVDNKMEKQKHRSVKSKHDEGTVKKLYKIIQEYFDGTLPLTDDMNTSLGRVYGFLTEFLKENVYGFDDSYSVWQIAHMFCKFVYDGRDNPKIDFLFYPSIRRDFLNHCIETGVIHDERNGELFNGNSKYWFQLTDAERERILKREKACTDSMKKQCVVEEEKEEPVREFDPQEELQKRLKQEALDNCKRKRDAYREKAVGKGKAKEFDALWITWVRETKADPNQFVKFEKMIQHLL